MRTRSVEVSIHATSPLFGVGAGLASSFFASAAGAFASSFFASAEGLASGAALSCANVRPAKASASMTARNAQIFVIAFSLERRRIGLAGADANDLRKIEHEDLAVADLAGVRGFLDRLDRLLEQLRLDRRLHLHLGEEIDHVLGAAVELGVALLPAEAFDLGDGDALHPDRRQRFADLVELEGLDDCRD